MLHRPTAHRWWLRCYPIGTDAHVGGCGPCFKDAMRWTLATERASDAPSVHPRSAANRFAACVAAAVSSGGLEAK
jgi:hypothetical protein